MVRVFVLKEDEYMKFAYLHFCVKRLAIELKFQHTKELHDN